LKAVRAQVGRAARRLARAERAHGRAAATARARDARACRAVRHAYETLRAAYAGARVALLPVFPEGCEPYVRALLTERLPPWPTPPP
jgi:hypothetical protein